MKRLITISKGISCKIRLINCDSHMSVTHKPWSLLIFYFPYRGIFTNGQSSVLGSSLGSEYRVVPPGGVIVNSQHSVPIGQVGK